jgi:multisubunit Na+/H+ antiporter MnhC subunit
MKNIQFYRWIGLIPSLAGASCGIITIFICRKIWAVKLPPGLTVTEYHQWLRTHASLDDLRDLAVNGDDAVAALCNFVLVLSALLIGLAICNAILVACVLLEKRRQLAEEKQLN